MKEHNSSIGLSELCGLFGKTRQAYYKTIWNTREKAMEEAIILEMVQEVRVKMPRIGTRKLYHMLKQPFQQHNINIGRDTLFDILLEHGLMLRRKKRKAVTTLSRHWYRKYANLIRELKVEAPNQLWVSDITYISTVNGFIYLSLITDAYSRKIIGYCLNESLASEGCIKALNMALSTYHLKQNNLIHHSDRGIQYCSKEYVKILESKGIAISMTEKGDPYENAIAERVNGILKTEFGIDRIFKNYNEALMQIEQCIVTYNELRPHASCNYLTPAEAHSKTGVLNKRWKNYYQKKKQKQGMEPGNGFIRHEPKACDIKEMPASEGWYNTIGSGYSFPGCSPAEPESTLPDYTKLAYVNHLQD